MSQSQAHSGRLIVMDDEPEICDLVRRLAERMGFAVEAPATAAAFRRAAREFSPALILLDLQMPEHDGVELLRDMADDGVGAAIALMSGTDRRVLEAAGRIGQCRGLAIVGVLQKPLSLSRLRGLLAGHGAPAPLPADGGEI